MAYVDGFIVAVPKKNINAYKKMSRLAGKVWRSHGALEYKECVADDVPRARSRLSHAASSRSRARRWSLPGSPTSRGPSAIAY